MVFQGVTPAVNRRKIISNFLLVSFLSSCNGLRCFICQENKIQAAKPIQNETGRYISYLNFGFCKDGNEVGKLGECRYNHDGGGKYSPYEDVTPFCGYYIVGALDRIEFYNTIEQKVNFGKIDLFQKLFRVLYNGNEEQVNEYIYHSISQNTLKDFSLLQNHNGVIRGCFGTQYFNQSKPEIQIGAGCHDIWKMGEEKKLCLCNGIGGYKLDGCNNKKVYLKPKEKYIARINTTRIPRPTIKENREQYNENTRARITINEGNKEENISAADCTTFNYYLKINLLAVMILYYKSYII